MNDEYDLLERARQLDEQALAAIFDQYYQPLYRYICLQIGHVQTAEDLTAEVFSRLLEALHNGKGPRRHLRAWLFRVAHNLVVDEVRHGGRILDQALSEELTDGPGALEEQVHTVILAREAHSALHQLTSKQRAVIILKYLVGMSNDEVAHSLSLPVTAVKSLQHRGLTSLRRKLAQASTWAVERKMP